MLKKEIEDFIDEFISIKSNEKYVKRNFCHFKNGKCANFWFNKYKEEILSSEDPKCLQIKENYESTMALSRKKSVNYNNAVCISSFINGKLLKEFISIKDFRKFEPNCKILLSNDENAYEWFQKNKAKISTCNDHNYKIAKEQYLEYKKIKMKKNELRFKKDELFFYNEKNLYKFNILCEIILPSGIKAGKWFFDNKDFLLSNDGPLEKEITHQYNIYEGYLALLLEFYNERDLSKFSFDSNIRFSSGALMNLWWEDNEEKIRELNFYFDNLVIEQYEQYKKKFE